MIKNLKVKKILIDYVFPIFSFFNKFIKKNDKIIFIYCANDELNDNSLELFNYLLTKGYNKKYHIVCGVGDPKEYKDRKTLNVEFISKRKCIFQYMKSGHVYYSMGKIPIKPTRNQCVINLWHGIPLKKIGKLLNNNSGNEFFFTYLCASSELYRPIMAKAFGCPEENVFICGEQKQDKLFEEKNDKIEKLIIWTPTFRQSSYLGYCDSRDESLLPPLHNNNWDELNQILKKNHIKMLVKLHPMQNTNGFVKEEKSHLKIMSDLYFKNQGLDLYSLLAQSDALIVDYSSVYLEYLIVNRPICFSMADFDEYSKSRGFVFDNPLEYMPGYFAHNKEQLYKFIEMIHYGIDPYKLKRELVRDKVHHYQDNQNCKRVLDISGITLEMD